MSRFHIAFVVLAARFLGSRIGAAASTESRCMERAKKKRNKEIRKCKNPEPECVERAKKKFQKKKKKCLRPCLAWNQIGDDIDGDAPSDGFGGAVRLSADGSRMAFGARGGGEAGRGRVIILERNGEDWVQVGGPIDGSDAGDAMGTLSLSADGSAVAVGSHWYNSFSGQVRVFALKENSWEQIGKDILGEDAQDWFGYNLSLSGDGKTLAVGAPSRSTGAGARSGYVRVYRPDAVSGAWWQAGSDIDGEAAGDQSGVHVVLSADGDTLAVGAWQNAGNGYDSGHVRVFKWDGKRWVQAGDNVDGESENDRSGWFLSLSADGTTLAVGAIYNNEDRGHVRIHRFDEKAQSWAQLGKDLDGKAPKDQFGRSMSLSADGNTVAIGGRWHDGAGGENSGHARAFSWDGKKWSQIGGDMDGEAPGDWFGSQVSLSLDGSVVAVGGPNNDGAGSAAGHVRVFELGPCGSKK